MPVLSAVVFSLRIWAAAGPYVYCRSSGSAAAWLSRGRSNVTKRLALDNGKIETALLPHHRARSPFSCQLDDILEYFDAHQIGDTFGGPVAARLTVSFKETAQQLGSLPARIADRGRLRTMLGDLARTFHVGVLADCFFDPTSALCLKTANDQSNPQTALCQPTKCPNACIRARHLPAWQKAAADAKLLLKEKRLSDVQRSSLKAD